MNENEARSLLSADELTAASRFVTAELRARYTIQRSLIYQTLSTVLGYNIRQQDLKIVNGKPFLPGGPFFSYSHSDESLLLAIDNQALGVDLECLNRKIEPELFSKLGLFDGSGSVTSSQEFIQRWVVIESYFKFTGHGLPSELNDVKVSKENDLYVIKYKNQPVGHSTVFNLERHILAICADQINSSKIKILVK